ncbi:ankyrin repeat domain-containing protein 29 [Biomphalaria glabrata]|nr:ankyrin repeat domain-containing protein 29-like [Biomphalaria glabrata]KAI8767693.1 ankyrin repeat domain-containing protein 29 [Biomphalaria glabrata]
MSDNVKDELFKAIRLKDKNALKHLLENKRIHPDVRHERDLTPAIVFAVKFKNRYALVALLKDGANPNAIDKDGMTALLYASDIGNLHYLQILERFDVDFKTSDKKGATALMLSAQWGHEECVQFLLNKSLKIDARDIKGQTALMYAAKQGKTTCVQHLLNVGADKNVVCEKGYTALMHALQNSEFQSAKLLLAKGADVNVVGHNGKTALTLAFQNCLGDFALVENILRQGADLNLSVFDQEHLHEMIARGERKVVRYMILNGCPPRDRKCSETCFKFNHHGTVISPLSVALLSGHDDIARYLLINNFLTIYDILHLSRDPDIRTKLQGDRFVSSLDVLDHLPLYAPFSLYTLCFVKLCNMLNIGAPPGPNIEREQRLSCWRLPRAIQTELLFHGKFSRICTSTWANISLDKHQTVEACECFDCDKESSNFKGFKVV